MRKLIIILGVIIVLIGSFSLFHTLQKSKEAQENVYQKADLHPDTIAQLDDPEYQNIILPNELAHLLKKENEVIVYFYSPQCIYCVQFTPTVNKVAKDLDLNIYQFNLLEFKSGYTDYNIQYTPTIVYYQDGVETGRLIGKTPENELVAFLEEQIKKQE